MEKSQIILMSILAATTLILTYLLIRERKRSKKLTKQLESIRGISEDEMYGRGKFSQLGLMSAGITHEISNPLSIILGRITPLMRKDFVPENKAEFEKGLQQIKSNAERIATIIRSVREYIYRNEDVSEDFIPLKEIMNNVLVFYGQRLKNHDIELRLKNIDNVYVSGHLGQYEQAILNLVSNSFDAIYKLDEKWIEISANRSGEQVQIYLKDSGHGIPAEIRGHMLEPFYTTKKGKGTGLGLSLVKGIAQKHGGDLRYIEDPHTTFVLELPQASSMQYHH